MSCFLLFDCLFGKGMKEGWRCGLRGDGDKGWRWGLWGWGLTIPVRNLHSSSCFSSNEVKMCSSFWYETLKWFLHCLQNFILLKETDLLVIIIFHTPQTFPLWTQTKWDFQYVTIIHTNYNQSVFLLKQYISTALTIHGLQLLNNPFASKNDLNDNFWHFIFKEKNKNTLFT